MRTALKTILALLLSALVLEGASFTFGIGARSPEGSYPGALERILSKKPGARTAVLNAGWPGQNSYEVWEKLSGQIASASPSVVSILAGNNDQWKPPKRAEQRSSAQPPTRGFQLEWRSARLFRILSAAVRNRSLDTAAQAKHNEPISISDLPGPQDRRPGESGGQAEPQFGETVSAAAPMPLERNPQVLEERIIALAELGQRSEAEQLTSQLEALYLEKPDRLHAKAFLNALSTTGQRELAAQFAAGLVQKDPLQPFAWEVLGFAALESRELEEAVAAFENLVDQVHDPDWRVRSLRALAKTLFLARRDTERAISLSLESMLLDDRADLAVFPLRHAEPPLTVEQLERSIQTLTADRSERARLRQVLEVFAEDDFRATYDHNLRQMIKLVREAGARPLLLTYPNCTEPSGEVATRVAHTSGVQLVDVCKRFRNELETKPREMLFTSDDHCTEAGYEIIAEMVAEAILGD
jgi:lysophospholipase L1-like esterase